MRKIASAVIICAAAAAVSAAAQTPPKTLAPVEAVTAKPDVTVDLGPEFPQDAMMKGYVFTQTVNTIQPGQGRALHSHAGAPEIVRIISGTLTEAHDGSPAKPYGPGSTLINAGGRSHVWANLGSEPVVFVATSIHKAN
jgi:quercetin dioxygenase-like cupin family protein